MASHAARQRAIQKASQQVRAGGVFSRASAASKVTPIAWKAYQDPELAKILARLQNAAADDFSDALAEAMQSVLELDLE